MYGAAMHTVAVLALDKVVPFDLSTPIEVFTRTRLPDGRPAYRIRVCGSTPTVDAGAFTLRPPYGLDALADADTVILPGCAGPIDVPGGTLEYSLDQLPEHRSFPGQPQPPGPVLRPLEQQVQYAVVDHLTQRPDAGGRRGVFPAAMSRGQQTPIDLADPDRTGLTRQFPRNRHNDHSPDGCR